MCFLWNKCWKTLQVQRRAAPEDEWPWEEQIRPGEGPKRSVHLPTELQLINCSKQSSLWARTDEWVNKAIINYFQCTQIGQSKSKFDLICIKSALSYCHSVDHYSTQVHYHLKDTIKTNKPAKITPPLVRVLRLLHLLGGTALPLFWGLSMLTGLSAHLNRGADYIVINK